MKNGILIVILAVITLGACVLAFVSFDKQHKLSKSLEEEKYSRMVAEESSQKSAAKLAVLESQVRAAEDKMAKVKDVLDQEKGVNSDLKNQYEKLERAKADLEAKIDALQQEKEAMIKQAEEAAQVVSTASAEASAAP